MDASPAFRAHATAEAERTQLAVESGFVCAAAEAWRQDWGGWELGGGGGLEKALVMAPRS